MSDYKEYSCSSLKRFDFSKLPPGNYELKEDKIVRVDDAVDAAFEKFISAVKLLGEVE